METIYFGATTTCWFCDKDIPYSSAVSANHPTKKPTSSCRPCAERYLVTSMGYTCQQAIDEVAKIPPPERCTSNCHQSSPTA